jgi:hypothetical protein
MDEHLFTPDRPAFSVLAATSSSMANHLMAWTPAPPSGTFFASEAPNPPTKHASSTN